jgi:hypothetical protein
MVHKKILFVLLVSSMAFTLTSCGEKYYKIRFLNDDGSLLFEADKVLENAMPEYQGNTPLKAKTDQYTYTFKGWDKTIAPATADTEYTAVYDAAVNQFDVRFVNYDDSLISTVSVPYDGTVAFSGETPTKPSTDQYTYAFTNWDESLEHIKSGCVRKAVYQENIREYKVDYRNYDGKILDSQTIKYGQNAHFAKDYPTKPDDTTHTYTFSGWDYPETNIVKDMVLTAVFKDTLKQFTVTFNNYDGKMLYRAVVDAESNVTYLGSTPTKAGTESLDYTFTGWDKELTNILADTVITAQFESAPKTLYVSFKNDDGTLLKTETVKYGEAVAYTGATPTKERTAQYTYSFTGWDKTLSNITVNCERWAVYTQTVNQYTVTFKNYDGTVLKTYTADYGSNVSYTGATPTKPGDTTNGYSFSGWDVDTSSVQTNLVATAQFVVADYVTYSLNDAKTAYTVLRNPDVSMPTIADIPATHNGLPVTKIGDGCFKNCSSLASVELPSSITAIGSDAFWGCSSLAIYFHREAIGSGWSSTWNGFYGGGNDVKCVPTVWGYQSRGEIDNLNYAICKVGSTSFAEIVGAAKAMDSYAIPSTIESLPVTTVANSAFYSRTRIVSITIPAGCVNLGEYVFSGCSSLTTVNLPTDLLVVPRNGFQACTSLVSISIPTNVTTFGDGAFSHCTSLTTINIPLGTTKISTYLFWECPLITSFVYAGTVSQWNSLSKESEGLPANISVVHCSDGDAEP